MEKSELKPASSRRQNPSPTCTAPGDTTREDAVSQHVTKQQQRGALQQLKWHLTSEDFPRILQTRLQFQFLFENNLVPLRSTFSLSDLENKPPRFAGGHGQHPTRRGVLWTDVLWAWEEPRGQNPAISRRSQCPGAEERCGFQGRAPVPERAPGQASFPTTQPHRGFERTLRTGLERHGG